MRALKTKTTKLMELFFSLLKARSLEFQLTRCTFEDNEYQVFFEANIDQDTVMEILSEFDSTVSRSDLFETSTKITIILLPFHGTPIAPIGAHALRSFSVDIEKVNEAFDKAMKKHLGIPSSP